MWSSCYISIVDGTFVILAKTFEIWNLHGHVQKYFQKFCFVFSAVFSFHTRFRIQFPCSAAESGYMASCMMIGKRLIEPIFFCRTSSTETGTPSLKLLWWWLESLITATFSITKDRVMWYNIFGSFYELTVIDCIAEVILIVPSKRLPLFLLSHHGDYSGLKHFSILVVLA